MHAASPRVWFIWHGCTSTTLHSLQIARDKALDFEVLEFQFSFFHNYLHLVEGYVECMGRAALPVEPVFAEIPADSIGLQSQFINIHCVLQSLRLGILSKSLELGSEDLSVKSDFVVWIDIRVSIV